MFEDRFARPRALTRRQRSFFLFVFFCGLALLLALFLLPIRDFEFHKSIFLSSIRNKNDNESDEDSCKLRKEPLVLVQGLDAVLLVFESRCGLVYRVSLWSSSAHRSNVNIINASSNLTRSAINLHHYSYQQLFKSLRPGVEYFYQITIAEENTTGIYKFSLPNGEPSASPCKIAFISQLNYNLLKFRKHIQSLKDFQASLLVSSGAIIPDSKNLDDWQLNWFDPLGDLGSLDPVDLAYEQVPVLISNGNRINKYAELYGVRNRYFWTKILGSIFVFLDSQHSEEQQRWFEDLLGSETWKSSTFRILVTPFLPFVDFASVSQVDDRDWRTYDAMDYQYIPLADRMGLDIVLAGSSHAYLRGSYNGTYFFAAGRHSFGPKVSPAATLLAEVDASSLLLIELSKCEFNLWARNEDGHELDAAQITSKTCAS